MSITNKPVLPLFAVFLVMMTSTAGANITAPVSVGSGAGSAGNTFVHIDGSQNADFFSSIFDFFDFSL